MAIRFLTDSTSDILPSEAEERGISLVPLKVVFGDDTYRDNLDITHETFYDKLVSSQALPTTSQPAPADFLPFFEEAKANGDTLICLLISASLSGTVQSALLARDICEYDKIHIIDSREAIIGLRILVDLGCRLRDEGLSPEDIVEELERAKGKVRLYAMVDTLEYLHKGGRLSAATAVVGTILKVKPLVTLKEGKLAVIGKGRGVKDSIRTLLAMAGDDLHRDPRLPAYYGYTRDKDLCEQFRAAADEKYGLTDTRLYSVGAVIGTHVGPGAAVFGYLEK
jgi:DegV family protein with EDD domain